MNNRSNLPPLPLQDPTATMDLSSQRSMIQLLPDHNEDQSSSSRAVLFLNNILGKLNILK